VFVATRVPPSIKAIFSQANELWPGRSKASDGAIGDPAHAGRRSDHNPDERGIVHAGDLTNDPSIGCDAHAWAEALRGRMDTRVKYIISRRRIASPPGWNWRPYTGDNPHDKHVHVSIWGNETAENDTSPWFRQGQTPKQPATKTEATGVKLTKYLVQSTKVGDDGKGFVPTTYDFDRVVTVAPNGPYPPRDGYWPVAGVAPHNEGGKLVVVFDGVPNFAPSFYVTVLEA